MEGTELVRLNRYVRRTAPCVPPPARRDLLSEAQRLLTPQGAFVFKDWSPSATPIHWICDAADRYVTGDDVRHLTVDEAKALLNDIFGAGAVKQQKHVRPGQTILPSS